MTFQARDLAFTIDDPSEDISNLELKIACGTGTNPTKVDFEGKKDQINLDALREAMQKTLNRVAQEKGVLPPQPLTSPSS